MSTPARLGRYELLEQLGEGGMGAVWLARLTGGHGFEKLCIVKTVLPSLANDPEFVSRFLHEGRVLTQLHHANIAQVYDMGEEGGALFLALEYVPGVDLSTLHQRARAKAESLPLSLAVYIAQQMAEGLGYAHRRAALDGTPLNIVHRDVSPQNVMVSYDGEVKVIDFGIARSEARSRATAQASVMGKLGYMAPEQARGELLDHRADQYAIGVVLWELLSNEPFVPRGTLTEMVVAMASPKLRPLTPLRADVPPSLEATVLKALSPEVDRRFPTTDDFARALMDELLRMSALPSKLQVGEYVKARCEEAFASQQKLMTKVSTLRTPGATTESALAKDSVLTKPAVPPKDRATPTELDSTVLRPSGEHPTAPMPGRATSAPSVPTPPPGTDAVAPPLPTPLPGNEAVAPPPAAHAPAASASTPLTTGQLEAAALRKGRGPVIALAAVAIVLAVVVAAVAVMKFAGRDATTPPPKDARPGATPSTGTEAPTGTGATPTPPPGATEAAPKPGHGGLDAPPPPDTTEPAPKPGQGGLDAPPPPGTDGPASTSTLSARVRVTGGSYILTNTSKVRWTGCTVLAPGQRVATVKPLPPGAAQELSAGAFRVDASQARLVKELEVRCAEGTARVPLR